MGMNKKQHYIPQCYLRLFSDDGKHIWTYDKEKEQEYSSTISDVCTKNDFYKISKEYIQENQELNELSIEKDFFADYYEPKYSDALIHLNQLAEDSIKNGPKKVSLTQKERVDFATFLTIQWLRLPSIRQDNESIFDELMPRMIKLFSEGLAIEKKDHDIAKLHIEATIKDKSVYHAKCSFLDEKLVNTYAIALTNNIWMFSYSDDGNFYTSDFPITVNAHEKGVRPICQGLTQYGAELTFPLSKNLALTIWDKEYFKEKAEDDLTISLASQKEIRAFNASRYAYAQRQLFCCRKDFEFVKFVSQICPTSLNPFSK